MHKTLIIGGGWAGIQAAMDLCQSNSQITLVEASPQLGGRARTVPGLNTDLDNGQHLFIGAYQTLLNTLTTLGISEQSVFKRRPIQLNIRSKKDYIHLKRGLPPLRTRGLSFKDIRCLITFALHLKRGKLYPQHNIDAKTWLIQAKQTKKLIESFWGPLCLAALTTPVEVADARIFYNTLSDTFSGKIHFSDMLYAKKPLSDVLPAPAMAYLQERGVQIRLNERIQNLLIAEQRCLGAQSTTEQYLADDVIIATHYRSATKLCQNLGEPYFQNLKHLYHEPITTIYLQYPKALSLSTDMIGLQGTLGQWVFDRRFIHQPGLLAVVISGHGKHMDLSSQALIDEIAAEIHQFFPQFPKTPVDAKVIKEKYGAFSARVGIQSIRPMPKSPIAGLWLIGDYTLTPYPSSIEGALLSAKACTEQLQKVVQHDRTSTFTEYPQTA